MWQITDSTYAPPVVSAVYFLYLPEDQKVLHSTALYTGDTPDTYFGAVESFVNSRTNGTPLIPIDPHLALTLGWLSAKTMAVNMPYMSEHIRAAIALVANIQEETKEGE